MLLTFSYVHHVWPHAYSTCTMRINAYLMPTNALMCALIPPCVVNMGAHGKFTIEIINALLCLFTMSIIHDSHTYSMPTMCAPCLPKALIHDSCPSRQPCTHTYTYIYFLKKK